MKILAEIGNLAKSSDNYLIEAIKKLEILPGRMRLAEIGNPAKIE